jgi:hypothetical protein
MNPLVLKAINEVMRKELLNHVSKNQLTNWMALIDAQCNFAKSHGVCDADLEKIIIEFTDKAEKLADGIAKQIAEFCLSLTDNVAAVINKS